MPALFDLHWRRGTGGTPQPVNGFNERPKENYNQKLKQAETVRKQNKLSQPLSPAQSLKRESQSMRDSG